MSPLDGCVAAQGTNVRGGRLRAWLGGALAEDTPVV